MRAEKIALAKLRFTGNRANGGEGEIKSLANDINLIGIINPIIVKPITGKVDGGYEFDVVAGNRRGAAVTFLKWTEVPCNILEGDELEHADEIAGSENINRLNMHPLDEAAIFKKLLETGETIEALSKRFDRTASAIWQRLQLLDLNDDIKTLFRNGHLSLHSAAMLKSLSAASQKTFFNNFKNCWSVKNGTEIDVQQITNFISSLGHDHLYTFLKDKQCLECKTRTYFTDKTLFPELDDVSDSCLNHECYLKKWDQRLTAGMKSLKGEHKSHAASVLIVCNDNDLKNLLGTKITIDGTAYKVIPWHWDETNAKKETGAEPCFTIRILSSGKLEIKPEFWKKDTGYTGSVISPTLQRKGLAPIVKLLDLPKEETEESLNALGNRKRLIPSNFSDNVREAVFWRIMEIKAEEFKDPKKLEAICKELFLKKHLAYFGGGKKRIFELFVGKESIPEIAKLVSDKVFALLFAMELNSYELPRPEELEKEKPSDLLKWAGIPAEKLKQLYQEEIRKRLPKQKPAPAEKKQAKPKTAEKPAVKKSAKAKPAEKKPAEKKPVKKAGSGKRGMIKK